MKDKKIKIDKKTQQVIQQKYVEQQISKQGWKIIICSVITLAIGFSLLTFTNPEGNNWASIVSPIVIVLSYIFIGIGIFAK
jgi:uncharacterized membrane protein YbaN (DUF454 family)